MIGLIKNEKNTEIARFEVDCLKQSKLLQNMEKQCAFWYVLLYFLLNLIIKICEISSF